MSTSESLFPKYASEPYRDVHSVALPSDKAGAPSHFLVDLRWSQGYASQISTIHQTLNEQSTELSKASIAFLNRVYGNRLPEEISKSDIEPIVVSTLALRGSVLERRKPVDYPARLTRILNGLTPREILKAEDRPGNPHTTIDRWLTKLSDAINQRHEYNAAASFLNTNVEIFRQGGSLALGRGLRIPDPKPRPKWAPQIVIAPTLQ